MLTYWEQTSSIHLLKQCFSACKGRGEPGGSVKHLPVCQGPPWADSELCSHKFVTFGPGDVLAASLVLPRKGFLAWVMYFLSRWSAGRKVMWNCELFLWWLLLAILGIPLPLWWMEKLSSRERVGGWRAAAVVLPLLLFTVQVPFTSSFKLPFLFTLTFFLSLRGFTEWVLCQQSLV